MTPSQAAELLGTLKEKTLTLEDLYERLRTTGSSWTLHQLQLFLMCAPGVRRDPTAGTFHVASRGVEEELQDAIIEAARSFAGKAVPAAQVRARLPGQFVTTDEQILALARRAPGLEIIGPKLIRIVQ
jgi:hypothetical protein